MASILEQKVDLLLKHLNLQVEVKTDFDEWFYHSASRAYALDTYGYTKEPKLEDFKTYTVSIVKGSTSPAALQDIDKLLMRRVSRVSLHMQEANEYAQKACASEAERSAYVKGFLQALECKYEKLKNK